MNYKLDWSIVNDLVTEFEKYIKHEYRTNPEIEVYSFPQTWGSTALGYGGIGGSAMTSAQTIVLYDMYSDVVRVYFGDNRLGYQIKEPNRKFF